MVMTRSQLAQMVDHTLLKPEATPADVAALCAQANELGVHSICVSPSFLPLATGLLDPGVATCTVVGFPSGKHHAAIKSLEAERAVADGADEVDMVVDVGAIKAGSWLATEREVRAVRAGTADRLLKVILETAALTDDEIVRACIICMEAGAQFVKTSTGFHPAGGATAHAVSLMAATVGLSMGVKASGGIRTAAAALAMIDAGATRLGLSGTREVLDGLEGGTGTARSAAGGGPGGPAAGGRSADVSGGRRAGRAPAVPGAGTGNAGSRPAGSAAAAGPAKSTGAGRPADPDPGHSAAPGDDY